LIEGTFDKIHIRRLLAFIRGGVANRHLHSRKPRFQHPLLHLVDKLELRWWLHHNYTIYCIAYHGYWTSDL